MPSIWYRKEEKRGFSDEDEKKYSNFSSLYLSYIAFFCPHFFWTRPNAEAEKKMYKINKKIQYETWNVFLVNLNIYIQWLSLLGHLGHTPGRRKMLWISYYLFLIHSCNGNRDKSKNWAVQAHRPTIYEFTLENFRKREKEKIALNDVDR